MRRLPLLLGLLALLVGCTTSRPNPVPSPTATATWPAPRPYATPTPTHPPAPQPWPATPPPQPTPTPLIYTLKKGDTLSLLSARFGVPIPVILTANPNLNPRAMPIGATVVIPLDPTYIPLPPTPTPPGTVQAGPPACYPVPQGAWCFLLVHNQGPEDLLFPQGVLWVWDLNQQGTPSPRSVPLNAMALRLPAGGRLPMSAWVPNWPAAAQVRAELRQLLPLDEAQREERFPPVRVETQRIYQAPDGRWVRVEGAWYLEKPADWVRLVVWAEDEQGRVVALRGQTFQGPWRDEALPVRRTFTLYLYPLAVPEDLQVFLWAEAVALP